MNRLLSGKVVTLDAWVEQNYDYLWSIYRYVQEMNDASGRRVFDRNKCNFIQWCEIAYMHSTLYARQEQWMYEEEEEEEEESLYQGAES